MSARALASYLERTAPETIGKLRNGFPDETTLFSSTIVMGHSLTEKKELNASPKAYSKAQRDARLSLIQEGATKLKPDLERLADALRKRLKLLTRVRIIGGAIAAASGAISALIIVLTDALSWTKNEVALATAIGAMAGGFTTLFAGVLEKSPTGRTISAIEDFTVLVGMQADLEVLARRVGRDALIPVADGDLDGFLSQVDDMATKVLRLGYR